MEGAVAKWYSNLTRKGMADYAALAQRVAKEVTPGSRVLEVAPGPGYFAIELAKLGNYRVTGLDISKTFVEIAQANAAKADVTIDFQLGNASGMPFENETFDFIFCRAAFKNFAAPLGALKEMYRVLKPGGKALIIDLRRDASKDSVGHAVNAMHLGVVNGTITKLTFRFMLLKRAYTKREFEQMLAEAKIRTGEVKQDSLGMEATFRKHMT
jgi:ubiquinone/menaquinone biosynthesis C-methylase UbiE